MNLKKLALAIFSMILVFSTASVQISYAETENTENSEEISQLSDETFEGFVSVDGKSYLDFPRKNCVFIEQDGKKTAHVVEHISFKNLKNDEVYVAQLDFKVYNDFIDRFDQFSSLLLKIHKGVVSEIDPSDGSEIRTFEMNANTGEVDVAFEDTDLYAGYKYKIEGTLAKSPYQQAWGYQFQMPENALNLEPVDYSTTNTIDVKGLHEHTWSKAWVQKSKNFVFGSPNKMAEIYVTLPVGSNQIISPDEEFEVNVSVFDSLRSTEINNIEIPSTAKLKFTSQIIDITNGANEVASTYTQTFELGYPKLPNEVGQAGHGWGFNGFQAKLNHIYVLVAKVESEDEFMINGKMQKLVLEHYDLEDKAQMFTVKRGYYIESSWLNTAAIADGRIAENWTPIVLEADQEFIYKDLADRLSYAIAAPGIEYIACGKLIDKTDGNKVVAQNDFKFLPTQKYGKVDNIFKQVKLEKDHVYVFTEELLSASQYYGSYQYGFTSNPRYDRAVHDDLDDLKQTIYVVGKDAPAMDTTVRVDDITGSSDALQAVTIKDQSSTKTVFDDVNYSGLFKGDSYIITGELFDATSKQTVATKEIEFSPESSEGNITMTFEDATLQAGHRYVVFETIKSKYEYVFKDGIAYQIIEHKDENDTSQSFSVDKLMVKKLPSTGSHNGLYVYIAAFGLFVLAGFCFARRIFAR